MELEHKDVLYDDAHFHTDNNDNDVVYDNNENQLKLAAATDTDTEKYLSGVPTKLPVTVSLPAAVTDMTDTGKSLSVVPTHCQSPYQCQQSHHIYHLWLCPVKKQEKFGYVRIVMVSGVAVLRGVVNAKIERREERFIQQNRKGKRCN